MRTLCHRLKPQVPCGLDLLEALSIHLVSSNCLPLLPLILLLLLGNLVEGDQRESLLVNLRVLYRHSLLLRGPGKLRDHLLHLLLLLVLLHHHFLLLVLVLGGLGKLREKLEILKYHVS